MITINELKNIAKKQELKIKKHKKVTLNNAALYYIEDKEQNVIAEMLTKKAVFDYFL